MHFTKKGNKYWNSYPHKINSLHLLYNKNRKISWWGALKDTGCVSLYSESKFSKCNISMFSWRLKRCKKEKKCLKIGSGFYLQQSAVFHWSVFFFFISIHAFGLLPLFLLPAHWAEELTDLPVYWALVFKGLFNYLKNTILWRSGFRQIQSNYRCLAFYGQTDNNMI